MSTAAQVDLTGNNFGTVGGDVGSHNISHIHGNVIHHAPAVTRRLKDLARHDTGYNSHEREREGASVCAPETRKEVLEQLNQWAQGHGEPVCWLSGPAGAGKSTIAHTIAQQCDKNHCLAFSYFFSRRYTARSDLSAFISTFVYTLAKSTDKSTDMDQSIDIYKSSYPTSIEYKVDEALETNAGLFHQRLEDQLRAVAGIIIPILSARRPALPIVVVIDGLDEYNQAEARIRLDHLVQILIDMMVTQLHFRILFTSRPEADIAEMFELVTSMSHIALQDFPAIQDVENYLLPEFHAITQRRKLGADWPGRGVVTLLAEKSEGIFAYASTLVRFIDDKYGNPRKNLETAKQMHKGLDSLYKQVLEDAKSYPNFELVIGAITPFHGNLPIYVIRSLLDLESIEDVHLALRGCHSVMILPTSFFSHIRPYHTSLLDFLKDSNRQQDQFFKSATVCQHILFSCITHIIPWLQDFALSGVDKIRSYAFQYWVYHFNGILTAYDQESIESSALEAKVIKLLDILIPNINRWMFILGRLTADFKSDLQLAATQSKHILPQVTPHLDQLMICIKASPLVMKYENPGQEGTGTSSVHMHQVPTVTQAVKPADQPRIAGHFVKSISGNETSEKPENSSKK
ncbi:hypothetical protein C8J56DRAFT_1120370 [Mycena floridula]|nr:hypothetical protein C8J56DRAFT_1120370 [Mycena floridula]